MQKTFKSRLFCGVVGAALSCLAGTAMAQTGKARSADVEEVVVTARLRDETSIAVPVALVAMSRAEIERYAVDDLGDLTQLMPSLTVNEASSGSGSAYIRGIGTTASTNKAFDQTVSINIDGVQYSRSEALRFGEIDMARIEILKGPQALFYGRNSPAGVISIVTADPGDKFEYKGRLAYEFEGRQRIAEAVVGGPLSDTFGARLAVSADSYEGWFKNRAGLAATAANALIPGLVKGPKNSRGPERDNYFGRLTLLWEPSDDLRVRTKLGYTRSKGTGIGHGKQRVYCPYGRAQTTTVATAANGNVPFPALANALAVDDCGADGHFAQADHRPTSLPTTLDGFDNVEGKHSEKLFIGSVQADYKVTPEVNLTSITGLVRSRSFYYESFTFIADLFPAVNFSAPANYDQLSQEVRLVTNFPDSRVNGLLGVFAQDTKFNSVTQAYSTIPVGALVDQIQDGRAYSIFGQLIFDVTDQIEFSGGARYTKETRDFAVVKNGVSMPLGRTSISSENFSPELVLTYRPTDRLTVYGGYRTGFKAGGFGHGLNSGSAIPATLNQSYRPEKIKGFEAGLKTAVLENSLRLNASVFDYDYKDLQVNSSDSSTIVPMIRVTNAASAKLQGFELDGRWNVPTTQLELFSAISYTDAAYVTYFAPCYLGQMISQGCSRNPNPAGRPQAQDLSGFALANAPKWTGGFGFNYAMDMGDGGLRLLFAADENYRSKSNPDPDLNPGVMQKPVWRTNASIRLVSEAGWEVGFIGRNLTNEMRAIEATSVPLTGNSAFTGTNTPGGLGDRAGNVNRGRELMVQVTFHH